MEHFESPPASTPEANLADVKALREHLKNQGFEHLDDDEAVMKEATDIFSNYTGADIAAIITALYREEQDAAANTDKAHE